MLRKVIQPACICIQRLCRRYDTIRNSCIRKRGIAVNVPVWNPENCIQCNRCAYVCPHAVIRPVALTDEEVAAAPEGLKTLPMTGMKEYKFTMTVSAYDCTGCGSCANVCPGKKGAKALAMENMEANAGEQKYFDYATKLPVKADVVAKFKENTVKGSQFKQPLLEFSGACAGCGETPYAKLVTQLFGDRMYIANATGCSSIWGNSSPSTPYTVNEKDRVLHGATHCSKIMQSLVMVCFSSESNP